MFIDVRTQEKACERARRISHAGSYICFHSSSSYSRSLWGRPG